MQACMCTPRTEGSAHLAVCLCRQLSMLQLDVPPLVAPLLLLLLLLLLPLPCLGHTRCRTLLLLRLLLSRG